MKNELECHKELVNRVKDVLTRLVTDYVDLVTYNIVFDETLLSLECRADDLTYAIERYKKEMGGND